MGNYIFDELNRRYAKDEAVRNSIEELEREAHYIFRSNKCNDVNEFWNILKNLKKNLDI